MINTTITTTTFPLVQTTENICNYSCLPITSRLTVILNSWHKFSNQEKNIPKRILNSSSLQNNSTLIQALAYSSESKNIISNIEILTSFLSFTVKHLTDLNCSHSLPHHSDKKFRNVSGQCFFITTAQRGQRKRTAKNSSRQSPPSSIPVWQQTSTTSVHREGMRKRHYCLLYTSQIIYLGFSQLKRENSLNIPWFIINTVLAYSLVARFKVTKDSQYTSFLPQIKIHYCTVPCIHKSFYGKVPHLKLKYLHQEAQAMNHRSDLCAIS